MKAQMEALQQDKSMEARKLEIEAYEAETKRMEAQAKMQARFMPPTPEQPSF